MRRPVSTAVLVMLLTVAAEHVLAQDLATEVPKLRQLVQARIDAIGPSPATKAEKSEGKKLTKAIPFLDAFQGNNDIADFVTLGKAAKQIRASKTQDAAIADQVVVILECLAEIALNGKGLAEDAVNQLYGEKLKAQAMKFVAKGDALLDTAMGLLQTDHPKCHKAILKAWKSYTKGETTAVKLKDKMNAGVPAGLTHADSVWSFVFALYNSSNKWYFLRDVRLSGDFREVFDGPPAHTMSDVSLAALFPHLFTVETYPGGGIAGPGLINKQYPGDPYPADKDLRQYVSEYRYHVLTDVMKHYLFYGTVVLVISDKVQPGGSEKIFQYVITTGAHSY